MRPSLFFLIVLCCLGSAPPEPESTRPGKDHALFIAVDDYRHWDDLRYPVKDVERIAKELEDYYAFTTDIFRNPTRRQVLDKLAEYRRRQFAKDGQLLVFFSGHGAFATATSEGFFVPVDGQKNDQYQDSYLALSRLKRAVNAIPCDHILLAIDACYSGAVDDRIALRGDEDPPRFGRPGSQNGMTQPEIDQIIRDRLRTKTRLYFTSGGLEQTPDRSEFVDKFLVALGTTDRQEPILSYNGLRYFLGKARPRPRTGTFDGNQAGTNDFLFIRKQIDPVPPDDNTLADLTDWRAAQAKDDCAAYRLYLQSHPYGDFASPARQKIAPCEAEERMLAAWQNAKARNDCDGYTAFAKAYPQSPYASVVSDKLKALACGRAAVPDNMIFIPGGTFQMGDQVGDGESDEKPVHSVTVSDFYLSRRMLSFAEYDRFCKATGRDLPNAAGRFRDQSPVINVSWFEAIAYCNWWSEQSGYSSVYRISGEKVRAKWNANGYRLPTEAEWEYAARMGGKKYHFLNEGKITITDSVSPSDLGLVGMGNRNWEWCWDSYDYNYYKKSLSSNPRGPKSGTLRVNRGGRFESGEPTFRRPSDRHWSFSTSRSINVGFRLARSF